MTISPSPTPDFDIEKIATLIVDAVERGAVRTRTDLLRYKKELARSRHLPYLPSNAEILAHVSPERLHVVRPLLRRKPTRTLSGVAVVAVMTAPHPCPHGRCIPCPGGPPDTPQSYTGKEPAALRAAQHAFDARSQVENRLDALEAIGHSTDKIDLIVMGGTMPARDTVYQQQFVRGCFDGLNGTSSATLSEAHHLNERVPHRCIGLTFETRPDWCRLWHVRHMLDLGATRVELGVQILDDRVLAAIRRGHTVTDVVSATRLAKDAGLKVCYHLMPGLPESSEQDDIASFTRVFADPRFRPDMLKIYPTLVVSPSELFDLWRAGRYEPLDVAQAVPLIAAMKQMTPPWVRIQRVERDIPAPVIAGGIRKSNLRQLVHARLRETGAACRCIRCREIGHTASIEEPSLCEDIALKRRDYPASGGRECFLSIENEHVLVAYCRLRMPQHSLFGETVDRAIVRELKVHGTMVELGRRRADAWQHRGFGKTLLDEAERIARRFNREKLLVLSGVGARRYYEKIGYRRKGCYMEKSLTE
jgi:elongator complex protein 3